MTPPESRPESVESPPEQPAPARPSLAQILASVLTAVTTTFALSYLGVAGTIIGAGLASTFTVLANYWYTRSILHTQRKVNQLAPKVVRSRPGSRTEVLPRVGVEHDIDRTQVIASDDELVFVTSAATPPVPVSSDSGEPADPHALMAPARAGRRRFLVPILAVFVLLLLLITAIELGLGKPVSDALRGQEGSGTSVFNRVLRDPGHSEPTSTDGPVPTEVPTSEPSQPTSVEPTTEPAEPAPSEEPSSDPTAIPEPSEPEPEPEPTEPNEPTAPPTDPPAPQEPEAEGPPEVPEVGSDVPLQPTSDESHPAVDARSL